MPFTQSIKTIPKRLSVVLGFLFGIVSLSNGGGVGGVLGAVHDFISQAFSDGLHALESGLSSTDSHEVDGKISSLQGRNVDGLSSDDTTSTDSGRAFSGTTVLDGFDEDLDGVSASHDVDDFESVLDDSDGEVLLTGVSTVEHERSNESFDNGALGLSEFLDLPSTSSMGDENLGLDVADGDVILEADIFNLDFGIVEFTEKLKLGLEGLAFFTEFSDLLSGLFLSHCG
jgi:hypothetical protein